MSSQSGVLFRISTFGESHGPGVGVVLDGCPAGILLDLDRIQHQLERRRPGQNLLVTPRKELDQIEILSGLYQGRTLGTPIAMMVRNTDNKSVDYDRWADLYRPSHADYTYHIKYGYRTPHGGGRASVRETIGRVAAGAIAEQILETELGLTTVAWVDSVASIEAGLMDKPPASRAEVDRSLVRCPHAERSEQMIALIEAMKKEGDSAGGTLGVVVYNAPPGLGEPVFDKLEAELARACLSIPACKGFESGSGFAGTRMRGSEHNDAFFNLEAAPPSPGQAPPAYDSIPRLATRSNRSGGIQGGISNGMPITMRLAFKPVATIKKPQETVSESGAAAELRAGGRHDPCVLPRAVPIVEAAVSLTLMDMYLRQAARNPSWRVRFSRAAAGDPALFPANSPPHGGD
ncbi:MAG: chorismate synthase [Leptospirales bacterium]|nr:chorismate synthase [Leptospirales bacterium]